MLGWLRGSLWTISNSYSFFILICSHPQQLSTYALTLFPYDAVINGKKFGVGKKLPTLTCLTH
jgi:hypothetical protein